MRERKYKMTGLPEASAEMKEYAPNSGDYQILYYGLESGKVWVVSYHDPSMRTWTPYGWPDDIPICRTQHVLTPDEAGDLIEYTLDHGSTYGSAPERSGRVEDVDVYHGSVLVYTESNVEWLDYESLAAPYREGEWSDYQIEPVIRRDLEKQIQSGKVVFETEDALETFIRNLLDTLEEI